jgi:hypothetical protein
MHAPAYPPCTCEHCPAHLYTADELRVKPDRKWELRCCGAVPCKATSSSFRRLLDAVDAEPVDDKYRDDPNANKRFRAYTAAVGRAAEHCNPDTLNAANRTFALFCCLKSAICTRWPAAGSLSGVVGYERRDRRDRGRDREGRDYDDSERDRERDRDADDRLAARARAVSVDGARRLTM